MRILSLILCSLFYSTIFATQIALFDNSMLMENRMLILTKQGHIYFYDLEYQEIKWVSDIGFPLMGSPKQSQYIQPASSGHFWLMENGMNIRVSSDQLTNMIQNCQCFNDDLIHFDSNVIFMMDMSNGKLHQIHNEDIQSILKFPNYYEKYLVISISRKFISFDDCSQFTSQISINFLMPYLKGQKIQTKQSEKLMIHQVDPNKLNITYYQDDWSKNFQIQTDDSIYDVFAYDDEGLYQYVLYKNFNEYHHSNQLILQYGALATTKYSVDSRFIDCIQSLQPHPLQLIEPQQDQQNPQIQNYVPYLIIFVLILIVGYLKQPQTIIVEVPKYIEQETEKVIELEVQEEKKTLSNLITINKEKLIGLGAFGSSVYVGDLQGREVAVKKIKKSKLDQNSNLEREIKILQSLNSNYVVGMYLFEETEKAYLIAMEKCLLNARELVYVWNDQLDKIQNSQYNLLGYYICRLNQEKIVHIQRLTNNRNQFIKEFIVSTMKALIDLNSYQILHRDIRPDNILIDDKGAVKIADFGLSKIIDSSKYTKDIGSIGWRPKEIIMNQKYTIKADIFSLGCVIYFVVTQGSHPFGNKNIEQRIMEGKYENVDQKLRNPLLSNLIESMIQKLHEERKYPQEYLRSHPYFWTNQKKLLFLCEFSDFLETHDSGYKLSTQLKKEIYSSNILKNNWNYDVDDQLVIQISIQNNTLV